MNFEIAVGLFAFIFGAAVVGIWARARFALIENGAEARGRQAADLELATLRERLSHSLDEVARLDADKADLSGVLRTEQGALEQLRQDSAANKVRAEQASQLEQHNASLVARLEQTGEESATQRETIAQANAHVELLTKARDDLRNDLEVAKAQREQTLGEVSRKAAEIAELTAKYQAECSQSGEKLQMLAEAKTQMADQFQNLANQILEDKSQRFTQQNQENLGAMLAPLQERIKEFQLQVANTYDVDSKERLTLKGEIEHLARLNVQVSTDAHNLTTALKGSSKTQGIWGEMLLDQVLELSGLRKGEHYRVQDTYISDDGRPQRPDVVIHVPGGKHLIVDSKVSLVAYERYCNAADEASRGLALKDHLSSIRSHVKALSEKNYQGLPQLQTPDFVMLFIPVEPAFMLAIQEDATLFQEAYARNIFFVSPSTLQINLRTVANIWRIEDQNRNAKEIADQCARLYDKFVGFSEDLERIGQRLGQTRDAYDDARKKLTTGRGNLVKQVLDFKRLGVNPTKEIPAALLADANTAEDNVMASVELAQ